MTAAGDLSLDHFMRTCGGVKESLSVSEEPPVDVVSGLRIPKGVFRWEGGGRVVKYPPPHRKMV